MIRNCAVILAGGVGSRFAGSTCLPKQLMMLSDHPILYYSLLEFEKNEKIDEIAIVVNFNYADQVAHIIKKGNITKVKHILEAGSTRNLSSLSAIRYYSSFSEEINILFHDAARPFVSQKIINNCIQELENYKAVCVAIPATDTIVRSVDDNTIDDILNRGELYYGQTPQGFKLSLIKKAYDHLIPENIFNYSDDCSIVRKFYPKEDIKIVEGSQCNIKLTYQSDLMVAEQILRSRELS